MERITDEKLENLIDTLSTMIEWVAANPTVDTTGLGETREMLGAFLELKESRLLFERIKHAAKKECEGKCWYNPKRYDFRAVDDFSENDCDDAYVGGVSDGRSSFASEIIDRFFTVERSEGEDEAT